ncbi:ribonuclease HI [Arthrobacter crystallopoietes]|uniref:ribonuclease HI n=1 Tax=Crystallibacter crystallopoietes TaxID=37928 RepID=UPI001ABE91BE|nr:RNase H family protein [Arthrobacter crystallopoietes]QTG82577.1 hypothetical protein J5251_08655 [Arthrobacter crystallopoietes]
MHDAVRLLRGSNQVDIFCTSEDTAESLRQLGLAVSAFYPPVAAITAMDDAVRSCVDSLFTAVEIATDASRGRGSRWVGHGWVLTFAGSVGPVLGYKAVDVGNVLEGELRALRFALLAARSAYTGALDGRSAVTVSTDSQLALRMLLQQGFEPPSSNGRCASEVLRIRELTKHADVHFRWVKGHSGDPLNTFADRMAVLARRCREAGLSPEETDRLAAAVREEAECQLLSSHVALAA